MPTKKAASNGAREKSAPAAKRKPPTKANANPPAKKKTSASGQAAPPPKAALERPAPNPDRLLHQIIPYILLVAAIFLLVCFILTDAAGLERPMGVVGAALHALLCGLWSWAAFYIPLILVYFAVIWRRSIAERALGYKVSFALICITLCAALTEAFTLRGGAAGKIDLPALWRAGGTLHGGGVIGGIVGNLCFRGFGFVGTLIVVIALLLVFLMFLFGLTPSAILLHIRYALRVRAERREAQRAAGEQPVYLRPAPACPPRSVQFTQPTQAAQPAGQVEPPLSRRERRRKPFNVDIPVADNAVNPDVSVELQTPIPGQPQAEEDNPIDPAVFDEVMRETQSAAVSEDPFVGDVTEIATARQEENAPPETEQPPVERIKPARGRSATQKVEEMADETLDLHKIFIDPAALDAAAEAASADKPRLHGEDSLPLEAEGEISLSLTRSSPFGAPTQAPAAEPEPVSPPPPPEYIFPPINLLKVAPAPPSGDVRAELQTNAEKLVDTLTSFNVRTKIVNVSRGPTITRYELQPEAGTRVRSIANLVDDIALNLATTGVRIEAPIPGKSAVGIEVPNKVVATVYARELIESDTFTNASSHLTACLGKDVAGAPIYCDLAKMPHLLIAGTTGSGKSVCINSIILSILYKAKPEEVKLILIDPKKVELNVYNGIPHLLVPVVSDPKKAAGSLHWAVTEMERRYELIEEVNVRNIQGYNEVAAADPNRELLPQIVIIIDELADLMMTAKKDVEESICRIAQKARAAGMYLVIGTQRPSVDVITGLIKANVPSRIAFTVFSQVDSRTIIDIAGAEKLIGRGDMLYSPVGASRPVRVQGAFVSDSEVEAVTDFIKHHAGVDEYSHEIIESIEKEAARCGQSDKGGDDFDDEGSSNEPVDPMLRPALELAVECGKISTSLIQRRLSLGYGRAAKLIDRMERLGYVSPPDGQKPRDVLITRQQFMEMVVRDDEIG